MSERIIVVGGGVMGLATAWQLVRRGERPIVLERFARGHHEGASHGETRNFNNAYGDAHYLDLLVRPRDDGDETMRVGFTVTKKIGNAVVRNRMKRRFRALARETLPDLGIAGADHVLIGRSGGIERDYAKLAQELKRALKKVAAL